MKIHTQRHCTITVLLLLWCRGAQSWQQQLPHCRDCSYPAHRKYTATPNSQGSVVGPLYAEDRGVDLGIFGGKTSPPPPPPPLPRAAPRPTINLKNEIRPAIVKGTGDSKVDAAGEGKGSGGIRGMFRRIRDVAKESDDVDEAPTSADDPKRPSIARTLPVSPATTATTTKTTTNNKTPSTRAKSSSTTTPVTNTVSKTQRIKEKRKDKQGESGSSGSSWTSRVKDSVVDFFSSESSTNDNKEETSPKKRNSGNPLSVVQKFFLGDRDDDEEWVTVFPKTRISPGELVPVTVSGIDLLVIASKDGKNSLYCLANSCPHLGTPLELGQLVRLPVENEEPREPFLTTAATTTTPSTGGSSQPSWTELQVSSILQQDGCEDCIVCPLHKTAFALGSGQVRGEWCPYPPVLGKLVGAVKKPTAAATFGVRVRGKDVQVRINTPIEEA